MSQGEVAERKPLPSWTLVTSHGLVLLYVALHPDATIRQIAGELELTERRIAEVISDLAKADLLLVARRGRRNHYTVNPAARFRHPVLSDIPFNDFVAVLKRFRARDALLTLGASPFADLAVTSFGV